MIKYMDITVYILKVFTHNINMVSVTKSATSCNTTYICLPNSQANIKNLVILVRNNFQHFQVVPKQRYLVRFQIYGPLYVCGQRRLSTDLDNWLWLLWMLAFLFLFHTPHSTKI